MQAKYRKKPVVVEAMKLTDSVRNNMDVYHWIESLTQGSFDFNDKNAPIPASGVSIDAETGFMVIATLEGPLHAKPGDWVVRGIAGEFYVVRGDIFNATYEPIADETVGG